MDVERALIAKAIQTQTMQLAVSREIGPQHFIQKPLEGRPAPADVWEWMLEHLRRYRQVPSEDLFRMRWPMFPLMRVDDPFEVVLNQFVKVVKRRESIEKIRSLSLLVDNWDAIDDIEVHFFEAARDLSRVTPTTGAIKFSDSLDRREEYLRQRKQGPRPGVSMLVAEIDRLTHGLQGGELGIIEGFLNIGKAQPLHSKIATPTGWVRMGDISVGDEVVGIDGGSQYVTHVFPRGCRQVFRISFTDGTSTECCAEHLWSVKSLGDRKTGAEWQVRELREIESDLRYPSGQLKWFTPMPDPVEYQESKVAIDPYVMGVLLGDGSFRPSSPTITSADPELIDEVRSRIEGLEVAPARRSLYGYRIRARAQGGVATIPGQNWLACELREMGLMGLKSHQKFVPAEYLYGSVRQRLELLQGLCDTDGSVIGNGYGCEFATSSEDLAQQVAELARSLGGRASIKSRRSHYRRGGERIECRTSYRVCLSLAPGLNPFRLQRKALRYKGRSKNHIRIIKAVEPVGLAETQCIRVSNADHLYLTDDFIVTHNSSLGVGMAAKSYFERGETPLFMSLEMDGDKLANRWDAYAAGISYKALKRMELGEDELGKWETIGEKAANSKFDKDIIVIDDLYKPSAERVFAEIERWNPAWTIVDTIDEITAPSMYRSLHERQGYAARELKAIARHTKKPLVGVAQAGRDAEEHGATLGNIAGSIDIARKADIIIGLHADASMQKQKKMEFRLLKVRDDEGKGFSCNYYVDVGRMEFRPWQPNDVIPGRTAA